MSLSGQRQHELDEEYGWALCFLHQVGALEECEAHDEYFEGSTDIEEAKRILRSQIKSGKRELKEGQTPHTLIEFIKDVYNEKSCASRCPICEKNFGPD